MQFFDVHGVLEVNQRNGTMAQLLKHLKLRHWQMIQSNTIRLAFLGWITASVMLLAACASTRFKQGETKEVITDYGSQFIFEMNRSGVKKAIADVLLVLQNKEQGQQEALRLAREVLFLGDEILPALRDYIRRNPQVVEIRWLLCFAGDEQDLKVFGDIRFGFTASAKPISATDLSEALAGYRDGQKLIPTHFRTSGLSYNSRMTKAYVNVILGSGAFSYSGHDLMFHKIDGKWVLIWSRYVGTS